MNRNLSFRTKGKGRNRKVYPIQARRRRRTIASKVINGKTNQRLERLFSNTKYESFVKSLGKAAEDPKVRLVLRKGLEDGVKTDDIIRTRTASNVAYELLPIQKEIDLSKSLAYIGKYPKNVPDILEGKKLTAKHFGGYMLVTSKNTYIVDGHHRWSQVYLINPKAKIESIDLNVENTKNALIASQVAIASATGEVSKRQIGENKNIYEMPVSQVEREMKQHFTPKFYAAFYKTQPNKFKTEKDVQDHILLNILRMRVERKPKTSISRSKMPVFDEIGAKEATRKMHRGEVNIKKPYIKAAVK